MTTPRSPFQQKTDDERSRIESMLASSGAFWTIAAIIGAVFVGAIVGPFL